MENEISKDVLEIVNATTRVRGLQDILNNINKVIYQKNETISKIENEIVKRNAVIEKKQGTIDQMNKRIDSMINKNGVILLLFQLPIDIFSRMVRIMNRMNMFSDLR